MLRIIYHYAVAGLILSLGAVAHAEKSYVVTMKSISYDPKVLAIHAGESVEWKNASLTEHSATGVGEFKFDTGLIKPGAHTQKIRFEKSGEYPYHCSIHGKAMSGQINVGP